MSYAELADRFRDVRLALNQLADRLLNLDEGDRPTLAMNETLFSQIQRLFERTYAQVGINLEDCIIDRARSAQLSKLAGASARELSELARTFLRTPGISFTSGSIIRAGSSNNLSGMIRAAD